MSNVSSSFANHSGSLLDDDAAADDDLFVSLPPASVQRAPISLPAYIGFSAQSSAIPSIACDSDVSLMSVSADRVSRCDFRQIFETFK
jgi:hypothetical protein